MNNIIQNAVKIIDSDKIIYLKSIHRHDYVCYESPNGYYSLDGGLDYLKRGYSPESKLIIENYSLVSNSTFEEKVNKLLWGTRGKNGDEELTFKPLKDLDKEHLGAILETQNVSELYREVINYWIERK